jgi:hypothetical protein
VNATNNAASSSMSEANSLFFTLFMMLASRDEFALDWFHRHFFSESFPVFNVVADYPAAKLLPNSGDFGGRVAIRAT